MTGGSVGIALRVSCSRFKSCFFVVSCWSVETKTTASACAMSLVSKFTLIGFVGMFSLNFRIIFSLGYTCRQDKKSAGVFVFSQMCTMVKLNCNTKQQALYKWRSHFRLQESVDRFAIGHDNHWFRCPKYMSNFFEGQIDG